MQEKIYLCEEPHYVVQGEGNLIGRKMLLFRVAGCNVRCKDCDSPQSWNPKSNISYTFEEFRDILYTYRNQQGYDYVMITGGAPSLYRDFLNRLIGNLYNFNFQIEDDTSITFYDINWNVVFSISPKPNEYIIRKNPMYQKKKPKEL